MRLPNEHRREEESMVLLSAGGGARTVQFEMVAEPGSQVFVAGTFNGWNPAANPLKDNPGSGHFKATLEVPPGRHEYKFVVNGVWCVDPQCAEWNPNSLGSLNSVIQV